MLILLQSLYIINNEQVFQLYWSCPSLKFSKLKAKINFSSELGKTQIMFHLDPFTDDYSEYIESFLKGHKL